MIRRKRCRGGTAVWAGAALLAGCVLLSLARPDRYPVSIDVYYHMAAIEGFRQAGGLCLWAFWEFALPGRPHVYPPALHAFGFLATQLGASPWSFVTFVSWALWPLSLWLAWRLALRLRGPLAGLITLAFLAGSNAWLFQQNAHTANALALCLALAALLASSHGRVPAAGLFGLLAAGAHGAGLIAPLGLAMARLIAGPRRHKDFAWETALPVLGTAPWWLHAALQREAMTPRAGVAQLASFRFDVLLWAAAAAGVGACLAGAWRSRSVPAALRRRILPIAFLAAFGILFPVGYAHRFWAYNAFLPLSLLAGVGGAALLRRMPKGKARKAAAAALVAAAFTCWLWWGAAPGTLPGATGRHAAAAREVPMKWRSSPPAAWALCAVPNPRNRVLAQWLRSARELGPGLLAAAPAGSDSSLLTGVTGAWSTSGLLAEVRGPQPPTPPLQCDYLLDVPPWLQGRPGAPPLRYRPRPVHPAFEPVPLEGPPWNPGRAVTAPPGTFEPRLLRRKAASFEPRTPPPADVPGWALALGGAGAIVVLLNERVGRHKRKMATGALALMAIPWVMLIAALLRYSLY